MEPKLCECGCGRFVASGRRFLHAHHWRHKREQAGIPECKLCERCGRTYCRSDLVNKQGTAHWLERKFCGEECRRAVAADRYRELSGDRHPGWKGDAATAQAGRKRARRLYPKEPCQVCGAEPADIHHVDGNPRNNDPGNIRHLCRTHHIAVEDRMAFMRVKPGLYPRPRRTPELSARIVQLREAGMTQDQIAAEVGRSQATVAYHLRRWGNA